VFSNQQNNIKRKKKMKKSFVLILGTAIALSSGCRSICPCSMPQTKFIKPQMEIKPQLFANLGRSFSVPDGLAIDSNNSLVLAVPNYLSFDKDGAKIVTLNKKGEIINTFTKLPRQKNTGKVHPMGIAFGPDGNLYIADNQCFTAPDKSRILRLNYKNGKPTTCDVVVTGLGVSNAVRWNGDYLYLTDSIIPGMGSDGNMSGVYRFSLKELSAGKPFAADNKKHLILTSKGQPKGFGADGMDFDAEGNLYFGHFSGGQFFKVTFNEDGTIKEKVCLMNSPAFECCDGIIVDKDKNIIYIANSAMNAVWVYDIKAKTMQRLWQNPDATGEKGLLDQPCEPIIWNDDLYVVNFDMTFPGLMNRKNDKFNTISKFKLQK
jgi:sugar lactone lactonase YvrE